MLHEHFRQALVDCDVSLVRKLWAHISPHLPQPVTDSEILTTIHMARTAAETIAFKYRAYSHCWLRERNLPSQLPDKLKPKAERLYPRVVDGVGVSVRVPPERAALGLAIRDAMNEAIEHCFADGQTDPQFVRARMLEARRKVLRQ